VLDRRRGCRACARLRLRGYGRIRSIPPARRLPQRSSGRLSRGISLASPPRHRDDHLCAGGKRRSRRQSGKPGQARSRRRAVDDGRERNSPPRNAARRCERADARLPALGEPAVIPEDDVAALPDIKAAEIPEIVDDDGTRVRVVCGDFWSRRGPVEGVAADPRYLDVSIPPDRRKTLPVETGRHAFAYVFEGSGTFSSASQPFGV